MVTGFDSLTLRQKIYPCSLMAEQPAYNRHMALDEGMVQVRILSGVPVLMLAWPSGLGVGLQNQLHRFDPCCQLQ